MGPSRELGGQHVSRALGIRTWCTCPDVARAGPERGPDGTWAPGSSSPLCQALLHMFLYRRTEWIRAGPPGQRRSAPVLSLVPLCPQSFFRQVVFTSRSDFKDPLCFRRYGKQARLGVRRRRSPDLSAAGWDTRDWSGRAARRPRGVTWSVRTHRTKKAEAGARRDGTALRSPLPRPSPPLTGGASVLHSAHPQMWPFGGGVFKKRNGTALVFLVSQLAFSNIEHRPLLIYTDYHTFRVLKMILGFKN